MALKKRGDVWQIDIYKPDGTRLRQSTGTTDRKAAQEYHDHLKSQLWRQKMFGNSPERSWKEAVVRFLNETEHKASRSDDIIRLRWLNNGLGDKMLSDITIDLINRIGEAKREETSASTANRHLALISVILRKAAREWEWIPHAPAVKLYQEPKRRIRWLTKEEAARLLKELPDHLAEMARFTLATGLRMSNVTGLHWKDLDMERKMAWVHPDQAKSRKAIGVPLNGDALAVLRRQIGKHQHSVFTYLGKPVGVTNKAGWRNALKRAGIDNFRWHDLRHTWASWHIQSGTPLHALQELGGWESVEMVRRYAHLGGQHLAEHADRISLGYDTKKAQSALYVVGDTS